MDVPMDRAVSVPVTSEQALPLAMVGRLLGRHAWMIGLCALLGGVLAYAYASSLPRSYTSSAKLAIEGEHLAIPELQGVLRSQNAPDPMPWVRTEVQALTSRALIAQVVDQLHLAQVAEFNPALQPPTLIARLKGAVKSLFPHAPGVATVADPNEAVVAAAARSLVVFQDNRSLVIDLAFSAYDPQLSARFVNTLVQDYVSARTQRQVAANQGASHAMAQRIDQVRADLRKIEGRIRALRSKAGLVALRAGSVGQQQLEDLATAASRAALERATLQASWERASALANAGRSDALASVLESPTISRLRDQESLAASRLADLSTRYGPNFPGVHSARAAVQAAQRQLGAETGRIVESLRTQLRIATVHEAQVESQLADARKAAVQTEDAQAALRQLQDQAKSQRRLYQILLERAQQTIVQTGHDALPSVRLLSGAVPSSMPSAPNMKIAGGIGLVGGGVLGCMLALVRGQRADGLGDASGLADATGLPVLATMPRRRRQKLADRVDAEPAGPEAEALRVMRAGLRTLCRSGQARSVVFVPAVAGGDDAADVACAFARVAAGDGERVLLVEGDLRRPALGAMLGHDDTDMAAVLQGRIEWRDAIAPGEARSPDMLLGRETVTDAHALLSGVHFQNLLVEARDDYTLVVLDAPPAADAGAGTLAQRCDATVVVADARHTGRKAAHAASAKLGALSRNPVSSVLVSAG